MIIYICFNYICFTLFSDFLKNSIINSKEQSTSGLFLPVIITLFSTLAFAAILVVIFGVIIWRRKESRKKQRLRNERHHNQYKFDNGFEKYDDIIHKNEDNIYDLPNYYEINQNESKIEANTSKINTSKTSQYLEIY